MKRLAMYAGGFIASMGVCVFAQPPGYGYGPQIGYGAQYGCRPPSCGPQIGYGLHGVAAQLEQLSDIFDEQVERRYFRSPVRKAADDFADAAQELREEIEDGDFREIQREFAKLSRSHHFLEAAYGQCSAVPQDPGLSQLWFQLSQLFRVVQSQLGAVAPPVRRQPVPVPQYRQNPYGQPYRGQQHRQNPYGQQYRDRYPGPQRGRQMPLPHQRRGPSYGPPAHRTSYSPYGF